MFPEGVARQGAKPTDGTSGWSRWLVVLVVLALVGTACAGDSGEDAAVPPEVDSETSDAVSELSAVPGVVTVTPDLGRVFVSWPATEALAGSPVAGYEVQWRARGEAWDLKRRAVVIGLSYEVRGLSGGVHEVRVRPSVMERAQVAGASIVSAQGSAPTAVLVAPAVPIDEASNISAFDGVVHFEMTGEPVWPATIELPVDMTKIEDGDFIFLMSFNEEYQIWLPEPGAVFDHERGVVTAEVDHLSNWFTKKVSEVAEVVSIIGSELKEVSSDALDNLADTVEVVAEPVVNAIDKRFKGAAAGAKYFFDTALDGVVYVVENGHTFLVNTYTTTREVALAVARATWEAVKMVAAMNWAAFVEIVEDLIDKFTFTQPICDDTEPSWVNSVETPGSDAALIVCSEAVDVTSEQDLRLKVASPRFYPMLLTARDAANSRIKISPTNDDTTRVRIEQTQGASTLADVTVAWLHAAIGDGQQVLPVGATHWLRIPRSEFNDSRSMTLEGEWHGLAAIFNTGAMAVDLLADISGIPVGSDDISQLHRLSNEAAECFSRGYTTTSTEQQRSLSFSETTVCLVPVYQQALASKIYKLLLSPVIFLLEGIIQLKGYLEAAHDITTGKGTPTTTIHATPNNDNTQPDNTTSAPTPTADDGPSTEPNVTNTFKAVSAGASYSCGLRINGGIVCWFPFDTYAPTGGFKAVSAGLYHKCGLRVDDTITCWGHNSDGQSDAPAGDFKAVSAGGEHSCGLRVEESIVCWGDNEDGQTDAPAGGFKAVSAGRYHSCGLRTDDSIVCWGSNEDWQGNYTGRADAPAGGFMAVSAGEAHSCGLRTDDTITCWGDNENGQTDVPAGAFKAVSAGHYHSCGLRVDDTITCWGANWFGQTDAPAGAFKAVDTGRYHSCGLRVDDTITCRGDNSSGQTIVPGDLKTISAGGFRSCGLRVDDTVVCWLPGLDASPVGAFKAVRANSYSEHACGLRADDTITCWGDNEFGQADAPKGGGFKAVDTGRYHSCGLRVDDSIVCWGSNEDRQRNYTGQADAPAGGFKAVDTGRYHSCGLRVDDSIVCWGSNEDRQRNYTGQADAPAGGFKAVSAGTAHSCGLRTDDTITCWGANEDGQTDVPAGAFKAVSAGTAHSCGLRVDDTITCWGANEDGQTDVPAGAFKAVSAGTGYGCGLRVDDTITCWGDPSSSYG